MRIGLAAVARSSTPLHCSRRFFVALVLTALGCPRLPAYANEPGVTPIGLAESDLPAAVIMMRAAELTRSQENMLRTSAGLTNEERFEQGIIVGRGQATKAIDYLLANTKLKRLPGCAKPAETLTDVCRTLSKGDGPLTVRELLLLASRYELAREQIESALERLPAAQRREGAALAKRLRDADDEAKQPFWSAEGRFASGQMGSNSDVVLDEETRKEREAYLADAMDAARERLRQQRLERATAKAEKTLYSDRSIYGMR